MNDHYTDQLEAARIGAIGADRIAMGLSSLPDPERGDMDVIATIRADLARVSPLNQRLHDLVRHQRAELFEERLITQKKYTDLASDEGSPGRLEDYDRVAFDRDEAKSALLESRCDLAATREAANVAVQERDKAKAALVSVMETDAEALTFADAEVGRLHVVLARVTAERDEARYLLAVHKTTDGNAFAGALCDLDAETNRAEKAERELNEARAVHQALLNKVNVVTANHRHGNHVTRKMLDDLSN